jgi:hypothetical protein
MHALLRTCPMLYLHKAHKMECAMERLRVCLSVRRSESPFLIKFRIRAFYTKTCPEILISVHLLKTHVPYNPYFKYFF